MSLFSTMSTGTSGLGAASARLSVIGDNIANIGTTGFKGSRAQFADYMPNDVMGLSGPATIGTGAGIDTISTLFGQGTVESSENSLDMAISGAGFFIASDGLSDYYTRAGEFYLDDNGNVVTSSGLNVQGYNATDGELSATVDSLQLDLDMIAPQVTETVTMAANLNTETEATTSSVSTTYDMTSGSGDSIEDVTSADGTYSTSVTVYDALGGSHDVTVVFEKTADNTWSWYALADGGEITDASGTTGTDGAAFQIASGEMTFDDSTGGLTSFTQTNTSSTTGWNFSGAAAGDISFDFGLDSSGNETDGNVTQYGTSDSAVSSVSQDGYPPGEISSVSVDEDGVITGSFSNGQDIVLGQVALANFASLNGLERVGSSMFRATTASGDPAVGAAGTGGRGSLSGNALEASNVELETEFVDMITTQRGYQANARVVNAANDTLQELVQML